MKLEKTNNAVRAIKAGLVFKIYQMVVPFLMRTAMIQFMGVQYLGLNSLFASVLQVLNLAELGVGSAMVFSMYRPIAEDDTQTICSLMGLYRKYYRLIGTLIGVVGLLLTPVVPQLISGDIPSELNVYILYLLNLAATFLTYWLFAYKNCLLQAHQRTDVVSIISLITTTIQYGIQAIIIIWIKDYYLYVIVMLASTVLNNLITAIIVTRMYPNYKPLGRLESEKVREINRKIRDLFAGKLGFVIFKYTDTLVISSFLGLVVLAVYQNYYFILYSVIGILDIVFTAIIAGLGNSFVTESKTKQYADLEKFTFLLMWINGVCLCCFLGLYQPFMYLWVGQEYMLKFSAVICFAAYFYVYVLNRLLNVYKDAAALWRQDRLRLLVAGLANLGLNLLLVNVWGIYGVILSTVIAWVVVAIPWILKNLFSLFFEKSLLRSYIKQLLMYILAAAAAGGIVSWVCLKIGFGTWGDLALSATVSVLIPNVLFLIVFRHNKLFRPCIQFIDRMTKYRFQLEKLLSKNQT